MVRHRPEMETHSFFAGAVFLLGTVCAVVGTVSTFFFLVPAMPLLPIGFFLLGLDWLARRR